MNSNNKKQPAVHFDERVRINQRKLGSDLKAQYGFIVCGSGVNGRVIPMEMGKVLGGGSSINVMC
jgi:hypothetical protein